MTARLPELPADAAAPEDLPYSARSTLYIPARYPPTPGRRRSSITARFQSGESDTAA
jgi:hypothetical protein